MRAALCLPAVLTLAVLPAAGQKDRPVVLKDVRLLDGTRSDPQDHVSIVIREGKIAQLLTAANASKMQGHAQVLNLSGKTVMPGIINGHGHLGLTNGVAVSGENYTEENVVRQLSQYQRYGVTTVLSLGMNKDLLYQIRASQGKGDIGGPAILSADRGIGVPGGVPAVAVDAGQIYRPQTPEEARKAVQEMASRDANVIKIWVDDNLHKLPPPKPDVYAAAIAEAHRLHLRVAAHVYYQADAKRLLNDGVDILAHSIRDEAIDAETISLLKNRKVFYIPTLQLEESFYAYAERPPWISSPFFREALNAELAKQIDSAAYRRKTLADPATATHKRALQTAMQNLRKLYDAQVEIGFGTDSGANPYRIQGWAEHRELQLMVEAGLTPIEAIHCATQVNSRMLQLDEKTGVLTAGKQADLIVLDADPTENIANSQRIAMVFQSGVQVRPGRP